eukprot:366569-Chlamydomonas_euryale.AAC.9
MPDWAFRPGWTGRTGRECRRVQVAGYGCMRAVSTRPWYVVHGTSRSGAVLMPPRKKSGRCGAAEAAALSLRGNEKNGGRETAAASMRWPARQHP